jgi:translation elongation factor EF-Ts
MKINCETDFVAKNDKFQQLVSQVAKSLLNNQKQSKQEKVVRLFVMYMSC